MNTKVDALFQTVSLRAHVQGDADFVQRFEAEHAPYCVRGSTAPRCDLVMHGRVTPVRDPLPDKAVMERAGGGFRRYTLASDIWIDSPFSRWRLDWSGQTLHCDGQGTSGEALLETARVLLEVATAEQAECQGMLAIHAGAVSLEGKALLLLGESGAGKTTLSLDLCRRHGAALLADDTCFFDPTSGSIYGYLPHVSMYGESEGAYMYSYGITRRLEAPDSLALPAVEQADHGATVLIQPVWGEQSSLIELSQKDAIAWCAPRFAYGVKTFFSPMVDAGRSLIEKRLYRTIQLMNQGPVYLLRAGRAPYMGTELLARLVA